MPSPDFRSQCGGGPTGALSRRGGLLVKSIISILALVTWQAGVAAGADKWVDEQSYGRFDVKADFKLTYEPKLKKSLAELETDVSEMLRLDLSDERIELCVFADHTRYLKYVTPRVPSAKQRRAFFIKEEQGPGRVYAYRNPYFDIDVRHEATHALLHGTLGFIPPWLDEGLAEYFQIVSDRRVYSNPHLKPLRRQAANGTWKPNLASLEDKHELSDLGSKDYRESWAWVHFMLHGSPEARDLLRKYLADIQARNPPASLSAQLERRLTDVDDQLVEHIKNWKK